MCARLLALVALLFAASPAFAAVNVETAKLSHGVEAWYSPSSRVPVVDIQLSFEGAGSASDPAGKEGRAAFAANLLGQGAGDMDALAFKRALADQAITIDASVSADRLIIHVHALKDAAKRAGDLLALMLSQPRFDDADVARTRTRMLTGLTELEEDPEYLAGRAFDAASFAGHPYASAPDGTPRSLAAIAPQDVRDFLHGHLARGNVLIAAAGDVDEDTLDDVLGKTLDALPQDAKDAAPVAQVQLQGAGTALSVAKNVPQSVVVFGAPAPPRSDPQFYTAYLLNQILGANPLVSRLGQVVRKEKGLVYNVTTELDMRSGASLLRGSLATRSETAALATQAVTDTLAAVRDKGVTAEECSEARTYVLGAFPRELDGSQSVAGTLLMMRIWHLGPDYIAKRQGYFDAVRCEDIDALAAQLLDPKKFLFVTVGRSAAAQGAAK